MPFEVIKLRQPSLFLLLLFTASAAQAGIIRHDRSDSLYTDLAAEADYSSVGKIDFTLRGFDFSCSGVAIEPRWVLTAGHCINDGAGTFVSRFEFAVGGSTYFGEKVFTTPEWNVGLGLAFAWDLGLVRLSEEITGVSFAQLYDGFSELGAIGTFVGFGATGNGLTGADQPLGIKRAGHNVIDAHDLAMTAPEKTLLVDFDNPDDPSASTLGDTSPLELEYSIANGDSGGGLFIEETGNIYLAGINAYVYTGHPGYGQRAGAVRVSEHLDFIDDVIFYNSVESVVPVPVPVPASISLLVIGFAFLLRVIGVGARRLD